MHSAAQGPGPDSVPGPTLDAVPEITPDRESPIEPNPPAADPGSAADADAPVLRYRLDLGYDGTDFAGWARQPGLRTVQGVLESALGTLVGRAPGPAPRLVVAGRTDSGVHAIGQVAQLDLTPAQSAAAEGRHRPGEPPLESMVRRLNGILGVGADVVVRSASVAPAGFDARFSALWRRYEYRIADRVEACDPLQRRRTLWHPRPLAIEALQQVADDLLGLHDFAAFCRPREGATTIRTLQEFRWQRDEHGVLVGRLQADAFCHSMVRAVVGAALAAGEGRIAVERPAALLAAGARSSEFAVLPAHGLTLVEVGYPPEAELAERAERTRARRAPGELGGASGAAELEAAE